MTDYSARISVILESIESVTETSVTVSVKIHKLVKKLTTDNSSTIKKFKDNCFGVGAELLLSYNTSSDWDVELKHVDRLTN